MTDIRKRLQTLQGDFGSMARLLSLLFGFSALSLFAEGLYVPLKRLGAGLYRQDMSALDLFEASVLPLMPALLLLGALWQGRQLFQRLATGETLVPETATGVRRSGEWIVAAAVTGLVIGGILPGQHTGTALLVGLAAIGLALRSLAAVLDHAAAIKADNDQIV